jgi:Xaa-Pro aminopeptidase
VGNNEFAGRESALQRTMAEHRLDALLVSHGANIRYLTGFTGSNGLALVLLDRAVLFTDPRYRIQAAEEASCPVQAATGPLLERAVSMLRRLKSKRIGFEKSRVSVENYQVLKQSLPMRSSLEPVGGWIERLRMIKSDREIARIRRSCEVNSRAFEQAVKHIRPSMCETDLAAELEYRMRRQGAEGPAFETIVAVRARTALPHARPTSGKLGPNSLVLVDMGAMHDGYASDMTRMLFLGHPPARVRRMYRAVSEAQLAALDAVQPGVTTAAVDRAARRVLRGYGLDKAFTHSTGHGLGLEIHEAPRVGKKDKTPLEKGMTITIEPGVYFEGFGGIRIEDTVAVTSRGCDVLTLTSKELRLA